VAAVQTVLDTSLPALNGTFGSGVATTTTTAAGTTTTVSGPAGGANRATAAPNGSWFQSDVGGGATLGITTLLSPDGNGAAYFNTTGGASKADLRYQLATPIPLAKFASASYSFYRDGSSTVDASITPVLRLELLKNGGFGGSLILEYYFQNLTAPTTNSWTTVSATQTDSYFWTTNAFLGPTFGASGGRKSVAQWVADNVGTDLKVYGFTIGVGSGWAGGSFTGAADAMSFGFTDGTTASFDFAVASVPEPESWAMLVVGFAMIVGAVRRRRAGASFAG